ncbi:MAG TPA: alpha-L-fucosidase [Niabella sp.]|nr:alpha-L-fucosidase [Niabella sp.]
MNRLALKTAITILLTGTLLYTRAQSWNGPKEKPKERIELKYGPLQAGKRTDADMQRFREYGLGQFIHWGVYAIAGGEWNGVKAPTASEWIRVWSGETAPQNWKQTYDNLYKQFNPKDFDAKRWAKQAKQMGARYMIITTKHHDGFCLWPSKYSDYTIAQSPYKKDIIQQLVDAYTAEGIDVYLYFSIIDWYNKDYQSAAPQTDAQKASYEKFLTYTRNQLFELLNHYPKMKGFWFDGTWDKAWIDAYEWTYQLEKDLRAAHPGLVIGSRFRNDEFGKRHFDSNGDLLGDYEQGWERKLPAKYEWLNGNDWDCVMTIPPNGWGYIKDWSPFYTKTSYDLIDMLMHTVSMDGNLVINFGPDGNGRMHSGEDKLAKEIGDWMKLNSEAVYGATHAPLEPTGYGYYTKKEHALYLTIFNRPVNDLIRIKIPRTATEVPTAASLLANKAALKMKFTDIGIDLDKNVYFDITLPGTFTSKDPFVIKIETRPGKIDVKELEKAHM